VFVPQCCSRASSSCSPPVINKHFSSQVLVFSFRRHLLLLLLLHFSCWYLCWWILFTASPPFASLMASSAAHYALSVCLALLLLSVLWMFYMNPNMLSRCEWNIYLLRPSSSNASLQFAIHKSHLSLVSCHTYAMSRLLVCSSQRHFQHRCGNSLAPLFNIDAVKVLLPTERYNHTPQCTL